MKQEKKTIAYNRIWKWTALGLLLVVTLGSLIAGVFLRTSKSRQEEAALRETAEPVLQVETEAVSAAKADARVFLDRELPEPEKGDDRLVFRIIEVIPHDLCSVFPYLVDWGTEEEYDKNVPIGYEGLLLTAEYVGSTIQMFSDSKTTARGSKPFTFTNGGIVRDYLSVYPDTFSTADNTMGKWFRVTDKEESLKTELYGYFEYVGETKGLYYINQSMVAADDTEKGIHYEVQPIPRKGSEASRGELCVKEAAYYWAKDSGSRAAKPDYEGKTVLSQTGYNYQLSFQPAADGAYLADITKLKTSLTGGTGYDYVLELEAAKADSWTAGFRYYKGGNYIVKEAEAAADGKYVRTEDARNDDGYTGTANLPLSKGYFIYDKDNQYPAVTHYKVTFEKAPGKTGAYRAEKPENIWPAEGYTFSYAGAGKGIYSVPFLYAPQESGKKYSAEVEAVTMGQGEYALTSTGEDSKNPGNPVYSAAYGAGTDHDYAEIVTYLDFTNQVDGQYYHQVTDNTGFPGASIGGNRWDDVERGGWVFVPVMDSTQMKQTFLSKTKKNLMGQNSNTDAHVAVGTRIYVTNQSRRYRYYSRDGFFNNEWFKLLCYSNHPLDGKKPYSQIIDGVGYDMNKTSAENLANETTKRLLSAFDKQYRIEIIQRSPGKLTPEEVESADLIYFSNEVGIEGLQTAWNRISQGREAAGLEPLMPYRSEGSGIIPFDSDEDLSGETLMAIYDQCIYEQNVALMFGHQVFQQSGKSTWGSYVSKNLDKLFYFCSYFEESLTWSFFMPAYTWEDDEYWHYQEDYSQINRDASVTVCKTGRQISGGTVEKYNWCFEKEGSFTDDDWMIRAGSDNTLGYFMVCEVPEHWKTLYPFINDDYGVVNKVKEGESKYIVGHYPVSAFMSAGEHEKIWKIISKRKRDTSVLNVQILNAEENARIPAEKTIYANEFDEASFDVVYMVTVMGNTNNPADLQSITITFEDKTTAGTAANVEYAYENTSNVRAHFLYTDESGSLTDFLDPKKTQRKVIVTATDTNGRTAADEAWIIVREDFNLN